MKRIINLFACLALIGSLACQNQKKPQNSELITTKDEHFTQLFQRDSGGLTGADGTISIPMPDGSSVFMMGDSFLGEVKNGKRDSTTKMINNTFVIVNPEKNDTKTLFQGDYSNPESFVLPETNPEKFYWPGHGFVRDSVFHFFMSRFYVPKLSTWDFQFQNTDYFTYSWPDFKKLSVEPFKYSLINNVHWGHAVLDDGQYIYSYGSRAEENKICGAHVCRMQFGASGKLDFENVEFFNGTEWSKDPMSTKQMAGITSNISEQFSVFKYEDKYILLSQERGIGTGEIYTYTSDQPNGPWGNKQMVYRTTESDNDKEIITYNAMAHPQYIENGELLICYNVNALKIRRVFENANNYRPVFLRVPMEMILGGVK